MTKFDSLRFWLCIGGLGQALLVLHPLTGASAGSQVIGSYPELNGGFDDEAVANPMPVVASINSGAQSASWTVQNTAYCDSAILATGGRSSPKCALFGASQARRIVSPTATVYNSIDAVTSYVVQFYYRTPDATPASNGQVLLSSDATQSYGAPVYLTLDGTSGGWAKVAVVATTGAHSHGYGAGIFRFNADSGVDICLDDFVVYGGTEIDTNPPAAPGPVLVSALGPAALNLTWSAAPGGVDGGGYLVVRSFADPAVAPNANGIYAVGNSIGSGTVAYLGTNCSFLDTNLAAGQTYFYRVYTADKAFNYSAGIAGSGTVGGGTPAPKLLALEFSGNDAVLRLSGGSGCAYVIQSVSRLDGVWADCGTVSIGAETNAVQFIDSGVRSSGRFYRARAAP